MTDWHSKFGSGPAPIGLHAEIIRFQEIEEAALVRAERAIRRDPDYQPDEAAE